ncbi:hypothetical protein GmHk_20G057585 [Glycine max]|nr:hypothetical protein GmHk_20G057585 [Glycine max]
MVIVMKKELLMKGLQIEIEKKENLRQESIRQSCDKEATARVHQYIARFWFQAGLSFNLVKLQSFHKMLTTHCIDLMLEDICKLSLIKKTIQRAISLVGFICSHSSTLSLSRFFTNQRELVRHAITRIATSFLTLERLHNEKGNPRKMFVSYEWTNNKLSKEKAKGKEATKTILMPALWNNVLYILKVMAPFVKVLRLVDSEKKPAMGYIYEAKEKTKEAIIKSFEYNERSIRKSLKLLTMGGLANFITPCMQLVVNGLCVCIKKFVLDEEVRQKILTKLQAHKMGGAQWWRSYGLSTPNLQQLAIKIFRLTCSALGCECNWSVFEQKRNSLEHKRLHKLVYAKYNQALVKKYNYRDEIDPISLNDIDECNEWLVGQMDGDDENDDGLPWDVVLEASGIGQPMTYTRQRTKKRNEPLGVEDAAPKTKEFSRCCTFHSPPPRSAASLILLLLATLTLALSS